MEEKTERKNPEVARRKIIRRNVLSSKCKVCYSKNSKFIKEKGGKFKKNSCRSSFVLEV